MNKALNKEILRLAIPSVIANITVPLVGMVDTAVAGHLGAGSSATYIGAVSVGSMFFSLLYWGFSFLRTGTSGLTAQAFGRGDTKETTDNLLRAVGLALLIALVLLSIQTPFLHLVTALNDATKEVIEYASRYFRIRVWAAPATLSLMAYRGWFVGMQDSKSSMWTDLIINISNIILSIVLTFGAFGIEGLGFDGIALGTVMAQYLGFTFCILRTILKYKFRTFPLTYFKKVFNKQSILPLFKLNNDLFLRSVSMIVIYCGFTMISAKFGDLYLSCGSIMMQLLMLFSYFTDGFAYAAEALTGRFIGAKDKPMLRQSVKYSFVWSMFVTLLFMVFYALMGVPLLKIMTEDSAVIEACKQYLPMLLFMPPIGCVAFFFDGVFIGATESVSLRNSMIASVVAFLGFWYLLQWLVKPEASLGIYLLLVSYLMHLIARTVYLAIAYKPRVLNKNFPNIV